MSNRTIKKQRKMVKKEVRKVYGEGLEALGKLIYSRPRWCPRFVFILLFVPSFTPRALKILWRHL